MANKEMKTLKFPSSTEVYDIVDEVGRLETATKQDKLVDAINIKTVNGQSILGSGDLETTGSAGLLPSGVAVSTTILAYTEDKGIWVGTDNGYWYYWDDTNLFYRAGGTYVVSPDYIAAEVATAKETSAVLIADFDMNTFEGFGTITPPIFTENEMYLAEFSAADAHGNQVFRGSSAYSFLFSYFAADDTLKHIEFSHNVSTGKLDVNCNDESNYGSIVLSFYKI